MRSTKIRDEQVWVPGEFSNSIDELRSIIINFIFSNHAVFLIILIKVCKVITTMWTEYNPTLATMWTEYQILFDPSNDVD